MARRPRLSDGWSPRTGPKWLKWLYFAIFVTLLAPFVGVLITLYTSWGRDRLKEAAVEIIGDELGLMATLGHVEVSLLPRPTLRTEGIRLDHPKHGVFAKADALTIQPSLGAFFAGRLDLRSIHLEGPHLRLVFDGDRLVNVPVIEGGGDGPSELPFRNLQITHASLSTEFLRAAGEDPEPDTSQVLASLLAGQLEDVHCRLAVHHGNQIDFDLDRGRGQLRHMLGTETLQRLAVRGRWVPDQHVELSRVVVRSPHFKANLAHAFIPLDGSDRYQARGKVSVDLGHLEALPHGFSIPPLRGLLTVNGHIQGGPEGPSGTATLQLASGEIDVQRRGLGDLELRVELDPSALRIVSGHMQIVDNGGVAEVSGSIGLGDGMPVDLAVDIQGFRFSRFIGQLNVSHHTIVQWHLDGPARLRGTLEPFQLQGPITLASSKFLVTKHPYQDPRQERVIGATPATIRGRIRVDSEAFRFEGLRASTGRSQFTSDVHLRFNDTILVTTQGEIDLADASPLLDFSLAGRGPFRVRVEGRYSNPAVHGRLQLQQFTFNGNPLGDVAGEWHLEEGGLAGRFPTITASKGDSRYKVNDFFLDFTRDRLAISGQLVASRLTLNDFYHVFHYHDDERFMPYQGTVSGTAQIRFTHGHPGDSRSGTLLADMDLNVIDANLSGFGFQGGRFEGRWRWKDYEQGYQGGELTVHHAHLKKGRGTVALQGRMGLGGSLRATATADRMRFSNIEGLAGLASLSGVVGMTADIGGLLEFPRVTIDANVSSVGLGRSMLGDARFFVRMTDRHDPWVQAAARWNPDHPPDDEPCPKARLGFQRGAPWGPDPPLRTRDGLQPSQTRPSAYVICGTGLDGQLAVDMAIGRTKAYPLRGEVELNGFSLGPLLPSVDLTAPPSGSVSGKLSITRGGLRRRHNLAGHLEVSDIRLQSEGVYLRNQGPIGVAIERGTLSTDAATFIGPASEVTVSGKASERHGLAMNIAGHIDVGLLATLSPRVTQATGLVRLRSSVSGALRSPSLYGQASVEDASFRYAGFPEPLEELNGVVTFSSRRVLLEDFSAKLAGGEVSLRGSSTVRGLGLERYDLEVAAENVNLRPSPQLEATVAGNARIRWSHGDRIPHLAGTLRLLRASYEQDIALSQTLGELSRRRRAEVESYNPAEDMLSLDIRVVEDAPIRVDNNLINAEFSIEDSERPFRIVGTNTRLGAIGTLVIPRGVVHFRDADFAVRHGTVSFDDTESIDPSFDVYATTEVRRIGTTVTGPAWRIALHAHGTSDSFQLDTSSQPELSQEDIVLLLTVGLTRAEAEQLQAGDIGSTAALEALTAVTGIDREVQRAVQVIDSFAITSRYSARTGRTEPQISIGKRITDDVRLTGSTGISDSQQVRAGVEWQLSDETSVQISYDNQATNTTSGVGNVGADVRWRLEFD